MGGWGPYQPKGRGAREIPAKLSPRQRDEIRQKLDEAPEVTMDLVRKLALEYGVSAALIRSLKP